MTPTAVAPGTLYADWLRRRESLRAYRGEQVPIIATQLRVLDYLIDRYRDDAAALCAAPPPLDTVYMNQRAIVVNHHRSFGLVAGVKTAGEATSRVAAIVARMYDPQRGDEPGIDLACAAVSDDPWFEWNEPDERTIKQYWFQKRANLSWWLSKSPASIRDDMQSMPYLPSMAVNQLFYSVARLDEVDEWAAELLAQCRNRLTVGFVAHAWRMRVAAQKQYAVTDKLRQALVDWDRYAADTVRCLLGDEAGEVRTAAADLLAEVGGLRDVGILADLLAMPPLADEDSEERTVLANAMERLVKRLDEPQSALD